VPLSVTLSASWRDLSGRFASRPVAGAVDAQFPGLARDLVMRLQSATPVRTGRMKAGWRQSYVPTQQQIRITDEAPYWPFVTWGTSRQPANPNLQRVITQDVPDGLKVTADQVGQKILASLKG